MALSLEQLQRARSAFSDINRDALDPQRQAAYDTAIAQLDAHLLSATPQTATPQPRSPSARAAMAPRRRNDVIDWLAQRDSAATAQPQLAFRRPTHMEQAGSAVASGVAGVGDLAGGALVGLTEAPLNIVAAPLQMARSGIGALRRGGSYTDAVRAAAHAPPLTRAISHLTQAASDDAYSTIRNDAFGVSPMAITDQTDAQARLVPQVLAMKGLVRGAARTPLAPAEAATEAVRSPGVVDFIRVHGKDRLAQSWFARTARDAAEGRRITQWVADRANVRQPQPPLSASPKAVGADGAASVTGWGGDALHTQLLRERELAGSNVDHAVAIADTDGFRAPATDAVAEAYGSEIRRLQSEQGGRAVGTIRGLQQEMKAKLEQASQPMTRSDMVKMYRAINQQLTDSIRENPAKATDPFMRAEGNLRDALAHRVKASADESVARAFDEYHLANKAYESYGPMYRAMSTGSLKDPFTGVQTSMIQRIAGGPRMRMKTIGVLDALTPPETRAALRTSSSEQAVPKTLAKAPRAAKATAQRPDRSGVTGHRLRYDAETSPRHLLDDIRAARDSGNAQLAQQLDAEHQRIYGKPSDVDLDPGSSTLVRSPRRPSYAPEQVLEAEIIPDTQPRRIGGIPRRPQLPAAPKRVLRADETRYQQTAADIESARRRNASGAIEVGGAIEPPRAPIQLPGRVPPRYVRERTSLLDMPKRSSGTPTADYGPRLPSTPRAPEAAPREAAPQPIAAPTSVPAAPKPTAFDLVNGTRGETASGALQQAADAVRTTRSASLQQTLRPRVPGTPPLPKAASAAARTESAITAPTASAAASKAPKAAPPAAETTAQQVTALRAQAKEAASRGSQMAAQRLNSQADRLLREAARRTGAPMSAADALGAADTKTPIAAKAAPPKSPTVATPATPAASPVPRRAVSWTDAAGRRQQGEVTHDIDSKQGPAHIVVDRSGKQRFVLRSQLTDTPAKRK